MNVKTLIRFSWKTIILFSASTVGIVAGTGIASPVLSMMNFLANDGPYFSAPLIAFRFLALPIGGFLPLVQIAMVIHEHVFRSDLGTRGLVAGKHRSLKR